MSHTSTRRPNEGMARKSAREAVEREAAQRELQEKLHKIEILRNFSRQQFAKLNRSITTSMVWIVLLCGLFFGVAW